MEADENSVPLCETGSTKRDSVHQAGASILQDRKYAPRDDHEVHTIPATQETKEEDDDDDDDDDADDIWAWVKAMDRGAKQAS